MGNLCCKKQRKRKIVLLLVGLDNAGKTVAAKGLAGESRDLVVPTVGFSVVNLNYMNYIVKIFDLGGGPSIRGIWHKYFVDAHGVIFVIDSSDLVRLDEAKQVLYELLSHEKISRKPVLVLANKQDNENALDEVDIIEKLDLEQLVNGNECPTLVESCSATDTNQHMKIDLGIKKGYEWLLNYIVKNFEILNKRVEEDVTQQQTLENQLRIERINKLSELRKIENNAREDEDAIESYSNYERKMNGQPHSHNIVHSHEDFPSNSDFSEDSSNDFPPIHIKENIMVERPKSATQFVRKQLEIGAPSRKLFISRGLNKTAPLHLYGMQVKVPHSASLVKPNYNVARRKLKSAGDVPTTITNLPNVPMQSDKQLHNEFSNLIKLKDFGNIKAIDDEVINIKNGTIRFFDKQSDN